MGSGPPAQGEAIDPVDASGSGAGATGADDEHDEIVAGSPSP
jgi:hypothetical protein